MTDSNRLIDEKKLKLAQLAVFRVKEGELLALMLTLGRTLGLFDVLAKADSATASEVAQATDTHERWVTEWLYSVAAAGLVAKDGDRFSMTNEMRIVLGDTEHPAFTGGIFTGPPLPDTIDRLTEAFRTGVGFGWNDHGAGVAAMQRAMGTNNKRAHLVDEVLSSMPGLVQKLTDGVRVVDVGCGAGDLALAMAQAFPASSVLGLDPSEHAIAIAEDLAASSGLDNIGFRIGTFDDLEAQGAEVITTFDVLHDLPFPAEAAAAAKSGLTSDGDWIVADIKAGANFEENAKIPTRSLFYSMSVMYCMNSAMSEPGGAGLGTLGLSEDKLRELADHAGFSAVHGFDFDFDVNNRYYHVT